MSGSGSARPQGNDGERAIKSQWRLIRRDAFDTAESAVASTWVIVACGWRRRAITANPCTSNRASGTATAISSHRRSLRDNKAHISGRPVEVANTKRRGVCVCVRAVIAPG